MALLRALPFAIVVAIGTWGAAHAPQGRKPFDLAMSVSPAAIGLALTKTFQMMVMVVVFSVTVLAVGTARLGLAFVVTMVVGIAWELAQTTVVGHSARVADLAPNVVAGAASLLAAVVLRRIASHE